MTRNVHLEVFEKHFKALLSRLQMDHNSLYSALMQKGLLKQEPEEKINSDQALMFLESIKNSLQDNDERFMDFLRALSEYVEATRDPVTEKLANDMYKDIAILTSQQNIRDLAGMYKTKITAIMWLPHYDYDYVTGLDRLLILPRKRLINYIST